MTTPSKTAKPAAPKQPVPAKKEGPTPTRTTREGASVGKAGNSTAGGAAGQLTPKD